MSTEGSEVGETLFEAVGGMLFFEQLVDGFYRRVADDSVLARLYPEADYGPAKRRLSLFLVQYWGGPTTYSDERGHPALRMRHFPFVIGEQERDHWLAAMVASVDELGPAPEVRHQLVEYFVRAAEHLRNDSPLRVTGSA